MRSEECVSIVTVLSSAPQSAGELGYGVPALDEANEEHDDGYHEKEVDESAESVTRDEAESPQDEQ
jgi:hypothetical protein